MQLNIGTRTNDEKCPRCGSDTEWNFLIIDGSERDLTLTCSKGCGWGVRGSEIQRMKSIKAHLRKYPGFEESMKELQAAYEAKLTEQGEKKYSPRFDGRNWMEK